MGTKYELYNPKLLQPGIRIYANLNMSVPGYEYDHTWHKRINSRIKKIVRWGSDTLILTQSNKYWVYLFHCYIIVNK